MANRSAKAPNRGHWGTVPWRPRIFWEVSMSHKISVVISSNLRHEIHDAILREAEKHIPLFSNDSEFLSLAILVLLSRLDPNFERHISDTSDAERQHADNSRHQAKGPKVVPFRFK